MFYFVFLTCVGHILGAHLYSCGNKGFGFGQSSLRAPSFVSFPSKYTTWCNLHHGINPAMGLGVTALPWTEKVKFERKLLKKHMLGTSACLLCE